MADRLAGSIGRGPHHGDLAFRVDWAWSGPREIAPRDRSGVVRTMEDRPLPLLPGPSARSDRLSNHFCGA